MSLPYCFNRAYFCALLSRVVAGSVGLLAALGSSCAGGGPVVDPFNGIYTLYTGDGEPHLLQTIDAEGNSITLLGERDANGVPTLLESAFVQSPAEIGGSEGTFLDFDAQSRPTRILAIDGTVIKLDWQSGSTVVVSAVSADGSVQVNTDVPLSPGSIVTKAITAVEVSSGKDVTELQDKDVSVRTEQLNSSNSVLVVVTVTSACGGTPSINEVLDVNVLVNGAWYNAASQGEGRYSVVIPLTSFSPPADPAKVQRACDGLGGILSKACADKNYAAQLQQDICGTLSAAFDANIAAANAKGSVLNQCNKAFKGLGAICYAAASGLLNNKPTPAEASSFVCSNLKDEIEFVLSPASMPIASASALIEGAGYVGSGGTVNLSNAFTSGTPARLGIQAPTQNPSVLNVTITPPNPAASVGYTAAATINCAAGHKAILTVDGSDGFHKDSVLISNLKVDTVELDVPGGASGVRDTITVSLDDVVVRTTSLVFGP